MVSKNNQRGQALPMNTIVIAILVVIVLVIVVVLFSGSMEDSGSSFNRCENKGGVCAASCSSVSDEMGGSCSDEVLSVCCRPVRELEMEYI